MRTNASPCSENDPDTIRVWWAAASEAIALMVRRGAIESGHADAAPARLVQHVIATMAHSDFFRAWIRAMSPSDSKTENVTFGKQFDCLHRFDGRNKPRSSWVDFGISLLIETERPWWPDTLTPEESQERFRAALWQGEVIPRIAKRFGFNCPGWLRSDLERPGGETEVWLWRLHWGPKPERGPYPARPPLGRYLTNLAFFEEESKNPSVISKWIDRDEHGKPASIKATVISMDGTTMSGSTEAAPARQDRRRGGSNLWSPPDG